MRNRHVEVSPRQAARTAGLGYLGIFVLAIFANFFVRQRLVEPGDAAATAANIAGSEGLFRLGLASFLVVFVLDLVVAWALYVLFRQPSRDLSLLTAWFRLVYTALLGVALTFLFLVLQLVSRAGQLPAFEAGQRDAQVQLLLEGFDSAWLIGLLCFGIHLALLGRLVLASGDAPKVLGVLLVLAGAGYVIDTLANVLLAGYGDYETLFLLIVAVPSVIGELALTIWLLTRAGREPAAPRPAGDPAAQRGTERAMRNPTSSI